MWPSASRRPARLMRASPRPRCGKVRFDDPSRSAADRCMNAQATRAAFVERRVAEFLQIELNRTWKAVCDSRSCREGAFVARARSACSRLPPGPSVPDSATAAGSWVRLDAGLVAVTTGAEFVGRRGTLIG